MRKDFLTFECQVDCPYRSTCCKVPTEIIRHGDSNHVDILIFGMGAGKDEEKLRRCFVGKAGKYMRQIIKHIWEQGAAFNLAISNNVRFHPMDTNGKDREPTEEEISRCIVHLRRDINLLRPKTIIPVGKNATSTFKTVGNASMTSLRGIPFVVTLDEEYTFIPTWHPSFLCRSYGSFNPEGNNIYDKQFIQDILLALGED